MTISDEKFNMDAQAQEALRSAKAAWAPSEDARARALSTVLANVGAGPVVGNGSPSNQAPLGASKEQLLAGARMFSGKFVTVAASGGLLLGLTGGFFLAKSQLDDVLPPTEGQLSQNLRPETPEGPAPSVVDVIKTPITGPSDEAKKELVPAAGPATLDGKSSSQAAPGEVKNSLYDELSQVRRAQTALSEGKPAIAFGLMITLDERQPDGALLAERSVTKVLALCQLGRAEEAMRISADVLSAPGGSVYRSRIEASCAKSEGFGVVGDEKSRGSTPMSEPQQGTEK